MMLAAGAKNVIACDRRGILYSGREGLAGHKEELAQITNPEGLRGGLEDALAGADVFVGVSVGGLLTPAMVQTMAKDPIVFALANPCLLYTSQNLFWGILPIAYPINKKRAAAAALFTAFCNAF